MKNLSDYICRDADGDDGDWCRVTKNGREVKNDNDDASSSSSSLHENESNNSLPRDVDIMSDGEKRGRYKIMEIDEQIETLQQLRIEKLKSIKVYDDHYQEEARRYKELYRKRCAALYKKN